MTRKLHFSIINWRKIVVFQEKIGGLSGDRRVRDAPAEIIITHIN